MTLPRLQTDESCTDPLRDSVLFAVYAPFGTDRLLSEFPGESHDVLSHPLLKNLLKVAASGVHVMALVDRYQDDTFLVHIPAGRPLDLHVTSRWKQDMASPNNLSGFLAHAARLHPRSDVVLALEGHGAGFFPDLDRSQMTQRNLTDNGAFEWRLEADRTNPVKGDGSPVLPGGFPGLPGGFPGLPVDHMPMSTYGLGAALRNAVGGGAPKLAVIHFNNCFNMSLEVLHTVKPYAEWATGYINYNFFTAGAAYPPVFDRLKNQGSATAEELSVWFALANRDFLEAQKHHPTVGCAVELARMGDIAERLDELSGVLVTALQTATGSQRADVIDAIRSAIIRGQQLDISGDMQLETPDEMTDLHSLAHELQHDDFRASPIAAEAAKLENTLRGIKQYGSADQPWTAPSGFWDFSSDKLAMNILLPDPLRLGLWDWRAPYYMSLNPTPVQPNIIDFLQATKRWVEFLIEYHKDVPFNGVLPAAVPQLPLFNRDSEKIVYPKPQPCRRGHPPKKK
jgi:hypothetical protein